MTAQFIGYLLACLILPIVWGIVVNRIFQWWDGNSRRDSPLNDYQI